MSYSSTTKPRYASGAAEPLRMKSSKSLPRPLAALARINFACDCKVTMITSCILYKTPGCEERRADGICGCRPRWLPVCILDPATPHGCPDWAVGATCHCERMLMPRCLVTGCKQRQRGRRCDSRFCTRTPVGVCPHFQAELERYKNLTPRDAADIMGEITRQLEIVRPRAYREPRRAGAGVRARAGEAAVALMQRRKHHDLRLWHPDDERYIDDEEMQRKHARRLEQGLARLAAAVLLPSGSGRAS